MLKNIWLRKGLLVAAILLLMSLALSWINGTVATRERHQQNAQQRVAESHPGEQTLIGPVLVVPYQEHYLHDVCDDKGKLLRQEPRSQRYEARFFPDQMQLEGHISVHTRAVGIHPVRVYGLKGVLRGQFGVPDETQFVHHHRDSQLIIGKPSLVLALRDLRGFAIVPQLQWGEQILVAQSGTDSEVLATGVHFDLPALPKGGAASRFMLALDLSGMQSFAVVPVGRDNQVSLTSSWPHPSFGGHFLPRSEGRKITPEGFSAQWSLPSLATAAQRTVAQASKENEIWNADRIEVRFIDPINIYSLSWRATEYGLLFIVIMFAAFFLFEVLKSLRIHAIQYAFIGAAQAIFFLLLLALSEQFAFLASYVTAATACLLLTAIYLRHVLGSALRSLGFSVLLGVLYGLLYGILSAEDLAFLLGTALVFTGLAAMMLVTRKIDWHQYLGGVGGAGGTEPAASTGEST